MLLVLLAAVWAAGCNASRQVAVRVMIPGADSADAPVSGLALVALPYDRDSILTTLERQARSSRPSTAALDTLFQRFREPFSFYARTSLTADRLRDSVAEARHTLDSLPRNAPDYRTLYARFVRQSAALDSAAAGRDSARTALDAARTAVATRGDSLRALVRNWEDSTYRGYDSIVRSLVQRGSRVPATDTTGADGWGHFTLPQGQWWIYARSWDAGDPNSEWYWNVPVEDDTVRLDRENGRRRARY